VRPFIKKIKTKTTMTFTLLHGSNGLGSAKGVPYLRLLATSLWCWWSSPGSRHDNFATVSAGNDQGSLFRFCVGEKLQPREEEPVSSGGVAGGAEDVSYADYHDEDNFYATQTRTTASLPHPQDERTGTGGSSRTTALVEKEKFLMQSQKIEPGSVST
ncbi:unnamed protein product, partial [Amoebophrya sp. A120]